MQTTIQQTTNKKHWWSKNKTSGQSASTPVQQAVISSPAQLERNNFYERAIEWTHRADKVINLVLGYLLAIASVLGFMDVLSNGQVLSQVPFMFYVWLGIMGLGVDFQILLVIGRIPDLFHMPVAGWQKWLIFCFNALFLVFLAVMSVMISAVFTQHQDMPANKSIADAMTTLNINAVVFVYGRAALATLLLVLMAVDRTMERWRMQIVSTTQYRVDTVTPVVAPVQTSDLDKMLQTVMQMNQSNLQAMQDMNNQTLQQVSQFTVSIMEESINRLSASISLPVGATFAQLGQGKHHVQEEEDDVTDTGEFEQLDTMGKRVYSKQMFENRQAEIEELLQKEPGLSDLEIANRVHCSTRTANKWRTRLQQSVQV